MQEAVVNLAASTLKVTYDNSQISPYEIQARVQAIGYRVIVPEDNVEENKPPNRPGNTRK